MESEKNNGIVDSQTQNYDHTENILPISNSSEIKKSPLWGKIVLIIAVAFSILSILFYGFVLLVGSGGISNLFLEFKPGPNPNSSSVIAKREQTKQSIFASFDELNNVVGHTDKATSTHDRCYHGQNNYKVQDGYANRCAYRITKYYGFNGDFREHVLSFEQRIIDLGWISRERDPNPIKIMLEDYYDKYYGPGKSLPENFPNGYYVSDLPTPNRGYSKNNNTLTVVFAEKASKDLFTITYAQNIDGDTLFANYDVKQFQKIEPLFKDIVQNYKYVVAVSIQGQYFEN